MGQNSVAQKISHGQPSAASSFVNCSICIAHEGHHGKLERFSLSFNGRMLREEVSYLKAFKHVIVQLLPGTYRKEISNLIVSTVLSVKLHETSKWRSFANSIHNITYNVTLI